MSTTKTVTTTGSMTSRRGVPDGEKTSGQGRKLNEEKLPPPNANIDPDRAEDLTPTIDLLTEVENEREVFTNQYKNADYLLKEYRETLRAVLEVDHDERAAAYRGESM